MDTAMMKLIKLQYLLNNYSFCNMNTSFPQSQICSNTTNPTFLNKSISSSF